MASKLKIGGAYCGVIEADLDIWTVPMLRAEVGLKSNCCPTTIKLIYAGRVLKDNDHNNINKTNTNSDENPVEQPSLSQLGLKNNAKILASKVSVDEGKAIQRELLSEDQRSSRLTRLKSAVASLASRHTEGLIPDEDYNIELENQQGQTFNMGSETDKRALMMGLMLHTKGKQLLKAKQFKDALEVLEMGEEAFNLCDPSIIELVDNVPMLQIDMVWCYFMLRDINMLSLAGERLAIARKGIVRAHGKDASRAKLLQKTRSPELALYLRLELLEGVAAFHCGKLEKSREALTSAKAKFSKLQVSDEHLSTLMSMGISQDEAKRALKLNEQDVESALNFVYEEREMRVKKHEDNLKRQAEIREQKKFGKTPLGKAVNLQRLNELVTIGYERELAAEVLRRHENDTQKALDDLTNPEVNSAIQLDIESKKRKRQQSAVEGRIAEFVSMGFDRSRATAAVDAHGSRTAALNQLVAETGQPATTPASLIGSTNFAPNFEPNLQPAGGSSVQGGGSPSSTDGPSAEGGGSPSSTDGPSVEGGGSPSSTDGPSVEGGGSPSSTDGPSVEGGGSPSSTDGPSVEGGGSRSSSDDEGSEDPSPSQDAGQRDVDMEWELAHDLGRGDVYSDYDMDVSVEAEALNEYLALLDSSADGKKPSS